MWDGGATGSPNVLSHLQAMPLACPLGGGDHLPPQRTPTLPPRPPSPPQLVGLGGLTSAEKQGCLGLSPCCPEPPLGAPSPCLRSHAPHPC